VKVAYVFSTSGHTASYKLGKMILPQLEQGSHGVDVVGMFFFDDNTYLLREGDPIGERLGRVAAEHGMLLMLCDQCALERCHFFLRTTLHAEKSLLRADGIRADGDSLQKLVRIPAHQHVILKCAGLSFGSVAHKILRRT